MTDRPHFKAKSQVRLLRTRGDIPAGTLGRVLGWFTKDGTYVVNFGDADDPRVVEVQPDEIELAELPGADT